MIKVEGLCFAYNKKPLCLKDVSFSLNTGEKLAALGGEEMGKTALLRVLCGLEKQYFGKVVVGTNKNSERVKKTLLLTDPVLFENKSIRYNIDYLLKVENLTLSDDELGNIMRDFNLNRPLITKVKKLSLFEKRLLTFVRAKIKNADYLFIDDQTKDLSDEEIEIIKNAILKLINGKNGSKTCVLVFENEKSVLPTDKVLYLSFSKSYEAKTIEDLGQIDLYSLNYLPYNQKEYILKREECFYLYEFEMIKEKKKEKINLLNKIKLSDDVGELLSKATLLNQDEYFRAILSFKKDVDIQSLSDDKISKGLLSHELHLYSYGTGEKLI